MLLSRNWDCVILDECHYLSNRKSKRTKFILGQLAKRTTHLWGLSGTPAKNHAAELWPLLSAMGAYAGNYWDFVAEFMETKQTPFGIEIRGVKPSQQHRLRSLLDSVMLRRLRKDVMKDLPALAFYDVVVEPAPVKIRRWFAEVVLSPHREPELIEEIAEEIRATEHVLELTGASEASVEILTGLGAKTLQSRRYIGLQKAPTVAAMVSEELGNNAYEKIVLFAWHRAVIECLREELKIWNPETLYGGVLISKREYVLRKFHKDPRCRVLICNLTVAGVAIDLTAATEVGFVEASYVPADNAQAVLRVHRYPQNKPVRVRFFSLHHHVDFQIHKILRRKTTDLVALFDTPPATPIPVASGAINPFE